MEKMKGKILVIMAMLLVVGITVFSGCIEKELVYSESGDIFKGQLIKKGLKPNTDYMLCINGKPGLPGNDCLKKYGIWGNEGYYDFKRVTTDEKGVLNVTFAAELQEGEYYVKFAIKDITAGWKWIEIDQNVHFEIKPTQKK
jgi:hypothetical protein